MLFAALLPLFAARRCCFAAFGWATRPDVQHCFKLN
jgi:hypothetical protein